MDSQVACPSTKLIFSLMMRPMVWYGVLAVPVPSVPGTPTGQKWCFKVDPVSSADTVDLAPTVCLHQPHTELSRRTEQKELATGKSARLLSRILMEGIVALGEFGNYNWLFWIPYSIKKGLKCYEISESWCDMKRCILGPCLQYCSLFSICNSQQLVSPGSEARKGKTHCLFST